MSSLTGIAQNRAWPSRIVVLRYLSHPESRQLAQGTINLRLGAVLRLYEAADCGLLSADLAAGIRRVKGAKKLGMCFGNWLTAEQGHALWQAPDRQRLKGKRDRAFALVLGCGLRRHEAVTLRLDHLQPRYLDPSWTQVSRSGRDPQIELRARAGSRNSERDEELKQPIQDGRFGMVKWRKHSYWHESQTVEPTR